MSIKLSICIPTYNRADKLNLCLKMIVKQVAKYDCIEVIVSDNASTDNTQEIVDFYKKDYNFIRYIKNEVNIGMDKNTLQCIEMSSGEYVSLFSDDDISLEGSIDRVLYFINSPHKPKIIYMNYYSFKDDFNIIKDYYFDEKDIVFKDGYEMLLYCGIGHFSAITFLREAALKYLKNVYEIDKLNVSRGYCLLLPIYIALNEKGKYVFVGNRMLAARIPDDIDYDLITNCCIDQGLLYKLIVDETKYDPKYIMEKLIKCMPKHILKHRFLYNKVITVEQKNKLLSIYGSYLSFKLKVYPLIFLPSMVLKYPYLIMRKIHLLKKKKIKNK